MKHLTLISLIVALVLLASATPYTVLAQDSSSAIMPFDFETDGDRQRYQYFSKILRCPMCQNQNLSGSNAGIATDLRKELHRLITEDYSDQQIIDFMQSRYGNFILYEPPVNKTTSVLWFAPIVFLLLGVAILVAMVRRQRNDVDEAVLSEDEMAAARKELLDLQEQSVDEASASNHERLSQE